MTQPRQLINSLAALNKPPQTEPSWFTMTMTLHLNALAISKHNTITISCCNFSTEPRLVSLEISSFIRVFLTGISPLKVSRNQHLSRHPGRQSQQTQQGRIQLDRQERSSASAASRPERKLNLPHQTVVGG